MKPIHFVQIGAAGALLLPSVIFCPNCNYPARITGHDSFYVFYSCKGCGKAPLVRKQDMKKCPLLEEMVKEVDSFGVRKNEP